jgi:hypothetical protein
VKREGIDSYSIEVQSMVAHGVSISVAGGPKSERAYARVEGTVPLDDADIPAWVKSYIMPRVRAELGPTALADHETLEQNITKAVLDLMSDGETRV